MEIDRDWEVLHAIVHPIRRVIIETLLKTSLNIQELSDKLQTPRTTLAYHLGILENFKIINTRYELTNNPGKLAKYYSVDEKELSKYLGIMASYPSTLE